MSKKIWNLMYVPGNPALFNKTVSDGGNPHSRATALKDAEAVAANGWRVWVERADTSERIFESEQEKAHQAGEAKPSYRVPALA